MQNDVWIVNNKEDNYHSTGLPSNACAGEEIKNWFKAVNQIVRKLPGWSCDWYCFDSLYMEIHRHRDIFMSRVSKWAPLPRNKSFVLKSYTNVQKLVNRFV